LVGEWQEETYEEQISGLDTLNDNLNESLERLRAQTEDLLRLKDVIRERRELLHTARSGEDAKHRDLRTEVENALDETDLILTLHGTEKDKAAS